jgi:hypothetical protein
MHRRRLIALLLGAVLAGCARTAKIYNVTGAAIPPPAAGKTLTMDQVARAIVAAGTRRQWEIEPVRAGELMGTLRLRAHLAVISIRHDTSTFSITFVRGENILHEGDEIHRNYNNWIHNLEREITAELIRMGAA